MIARDLAGALLVCGLAAPAAFAQTDLLIVSGLGGQPRYTTEFAEISAALADAASARAHLPDSSIVWLAEPGTAAAKWLRGASTRANVESAFDRIAAHDGQVVVVLVGHGAGEGADTRISLPGPDLTAADFARLLGRFGRRRVAFVNLTSASGDMAPLLASPTRVVMTATKSAFERNESRFARCFADAFARDGADTDKDGQVSLLEAFRYADAEVKRFYETEGRLATEHAQIADSGGIAARFFLAAGPARAADPRLATLYAERSALDQQVAALRGRKASMDADAYQRELERLLLALAAKDDSIRRLERVP